MGYLNLRSVRRLFVALAVMASFAALALLPTSDSGIVRAQRDEANKTDQINVRQGKRTPREDFVRADTELSNEVLSPNFNVSGVLNTADPTYGRPQVTGGTCGPLSGLGTAVRYDRHTFNVSLAGTVTIGFQENGGTISPTGPFGDGPDTMLFLYSGSFNPASPTTNCIAANDDASAATLRSVISGTLTPGVYVVVVTSFLNDPVDDGSGDAPLPWTYTLAVTGPTTAANVTVRGRVMTPAGRGLGNTRVLITDPNGQTRLTSTSARGYYSFTEVESGQTYVVRVSSKRYVYSPRVVPIADNIADLDFTPDQ